MQVIIEPHPERHLTPEQRVARAGLGFVYHESSQPFYKLRVLLRNLETTPALYVNGVKKWIYQIPRLISFLRTVEDINLHQTIKLHGGAVIDPRHRGVVITGWHDVGKTTACIRLIQSGYTLLGDDLIKLRESGTIERLQSRAGIYPHADNLKNFTLSPVDRWKAWFKLRFAQLPAIGNFVQPNLIVDSSLIGPTAGEAKLHRVYFLERGLLGVDAITTETAVIKAMATSADFAMPDGFPRRLFYAYCYANQTSPTLVEDAQRHIFSSAFANKDLWVIRGRTHDELYRQLVANEQRYH